MNSPKKKKNKKTMPERRGSLLAVPIIEYETAPPVWV